LFHQASWTCLCLHIYGYWLHCLGTICSLYLAFSHYALLVKWLLSFLYHKICILLNSLGWTLTIPSIMTCLLTIIAFNFWFIKPTVKSGSCVTTTNWISLSQDLYSFYLIDHLICWGCLNLLFQIFLFLLGNIQNHITLKKVFVHPHPLESHWLLSHGLLIFP